VWWTRTTSPGADYLRARNFGISYLSQEPSFPQADRGGDILAVLERSRWATGNGARAREADHQLNLGHIRTTEGTPSGGERRRGENCAGLGIQPNLFC